jgi:hypothetical protein
MRACEEGDKGKSHKVLLPIKFTHKQIKVNEIPWMPHKGFPGLSWARWPCRSGSDTVQDWCPHVDSTPEAQLRKVRKGGPMQQENRDDQRMASRRDRRMGNGSGRLVRLCGAWPDRETAFALAGVSVRADAGRR